MKVEMKMKMEKMATTGNWGRVTGDRSKKATKKAPLLVPILLKFGTPDRI